MQSQLALPHDPILTKVAQPIELTKINTKQTKELVETLFDAAYGRRKDRQKPLLVGLAAPQIGISKRIILVDVGADGKGGLSNMQVFINPEITWKSKEEQEWYEGCWSTNRVCGIVSRPNKVRVKALTIEGEVVEQEYEGYVARIFQHEIDHLNGKVFVDHITNDENLHWVEESEFPQYRNNEGWRHWEKKCSRKNWQQIKGITT